MRERAAGDDSTTANVVAVGLQANNRLQTRAAIFLLARSPARRPSARLLVANAARAACRSPLTFIDARIGMRAAVVRSFGGVENLNIEQVQKPQPSERQVARFQLHRLDLELAAATAFRL